MTVKELKAFLESCLEEDEIWFEDMNFGGSNEPVEDSAAPWITYEHKTGRVLVKSQIWEPCG